MEKKYILVKNNKEYTFEKYTDAVFQEQTSIQSLFNGSILKRCEMKNSDFSKSDLSPSYTNSLNAIFYFVSFIIQCHILTF